MTPSAGARTALVDISERVAVCASAACLAHCLLLPAVLLVLPALSAVLAIPEMFHVWVLAIAAPCALFALLLGRRRHGRSAPTVAGAAGLVMLALGAFAMGETRWEVPITIAGSLALAGAHIVNWRLRHRTGCACDCQLPDVAPGCGS